MLCDKVYRFRANEYFILPKYIVYFLNSPRCVEILNGIKTGISESGVNLTQKKFLELEIPLPPLVAQKRIADKLDTVLARVDACRERLDRIPSILKRFRQSVLAAATSGELTADWRKCNPPTAIAEAMSFYVGTPTGWRSMTIGDIAVDLRYGTSKKCDYHIDGTAVLRIPNIGSHNRLDLGDLKYAQFDNEEVEKLAVRTGDILVIRSNGSVDLVGKCAVARPEDEGILFAGYLIRIRIDGRHAIPAYVAYSLSAPQTRQRIELDARSTSGVNNINSDELCRLAVLLPSLDEQQEIIRRIEKLFAFADRLEARLATARTATDRLTPSLLAKAFRGELVPQDPNDEPASELLKRLAAQRDAAPKPSRGKKTAAL